MRALAIAVGLGSAAPAFAESPQSAPTGLEIAVTRQGEGPFPKAGQVVIAHYVGTLADGTQFDSSRERGEPIAFTLGRGQVIKGWDEAFAKLKLGSRATLIIPPDLAYGARQRGKIPPNSTLRFDVELVGIKDGSIRDRLEAEIDKKGLEAGLRLFEELRRSSFPGLHVDEGQLNGLGYKYLKARKLPEAVAVLRLNAELYPDSSNVHDSLGEALAESGDRGAAIAEYRRAIELDPKAENARTMLDKLTKAPAGS